ncbi:haloacid dehalogenase [Pandoraea pnomenusa]|uniref:Haloacid dehalogenase n=1 Tax=Pandoraea pnomenusa TaxID=93220 RepID=A0ABY6WJE6_9BURK|nr:haloacid dehalogenase [Pandoraea pnomenusa]
MSDTPARQVTAWPEHEAPSLGPALDWLRHFHTTA